MHISLLNWLREMVRALGGVIVWTETVAAVLDGKAKSKVPLKKKALPGPTKK